MYPAGLYLNGIFLFSIIITAKNLSRRAHSSESTLNQRGAWIECRVNVVCPAGLYLNCIFLSSIIITANIFIPEGT